MDRDTVEGIRKLPIKQLIEFWDEFEEEGRKRGKLDSAVRVLCLNDLFYLLVRACRRTDLLHPWIYARCREVEASPDGHLDLWAREHYKSTLITFGLTLSNILNDPEVTVGIFSHTRPIAKAFLRQLMRELEGNTILQAAFPDVLWGARLKDAPKWSEDEGIILQRKTNPNEATVEAWGVVDGQPTSKHFKVLLYDDVVVRDSVTNPEMMEKTMSQLEMSYNLGTTPGIKRFVGTRWHFNDAYKTIMDRGTAKLRWHPGRRDGEVDGRTVYWSEEIHQQKRRDMGPYSYASQILLTPTADALQNFQREWIRYHGGITPKQALKFTKYILVDSANEKRKDSDYTAIWVVGLGSDRNYYVLDMVRDRLNLTERTDRVFVLHERWFPIKQVRWERYGMMADIEHVKKEQDNRSYHFDVTEVAGITKKDDRIGRLIPPFEQARFYLPKSLHTTDWQKVTIDLVRTFIEEEYAPFPVSIHKDMLDALSRIMEPDLKVDWPKPEKPAVEPQRQYAGPQSRTAWMS